MGLAGYAEAVRWVYSLAPRGIRLDLDRMRTALRQLGSPERGLKVVHVGGTNGKGSVSAMIERGLRENGLKTGLYTSPHLHTFTERIRIDGRPIGSGEATRRLLAIRAFLERSDAPELTFFEVTTLLAFQAFHAHAVDVAVLEVGMGGRLDATNVIEKPLVTVVTRIAKDHEAYLGRTIPKIAFEKAGILKPGVPCLSGLLQPSAARVLLERARTVGAPLLTLGRDITASASASDLTVRVGRSVMPAFRVPLEGTHQHGNAALAAAALMSVERKLRLRRDASRRGLEAASWPGRLELVPGTPAILLDAAHNPDGATSLAAYLRTRPEAKRVLVFGAMRDKDWRKMLDVLGPLVDGVVVAAPALDRAERPEVLAEGRHAKIAPDVSTAIAQARRLAGKKGLVVVCGSIFVLAAARAQVLGLPSDPPIAM